MACRPQVWPAPRAGWSRPVQASVARPDAQTTNIQQHSQNLILNWDSYNVQANEAVNYRQPNANAQALNRILDHNPSQIFGQINANGKVLLVNPNGVFFKPGARVNVGGLVASGLNISDKDFLAGKYHFAHDGKGAPGAVINQGLIQAATGGAVSLIGGAVKNEGTILAHAGQVNLVAGKAMTMDFDGDGLIQFAVTEELLERAEGLEDAVSNTGTIKAEGGAVLLKGRAARDVFTQVVNNSGVIGAGRVESNGGVIRLVAEGPGNSLLNTGTLNAASEKGAGGTVKLKAEGKVAVSGKARITAASRTGNGGRIDIRGADVAVSDSALITAASGVGQGQAGDALLNVDSSFRWNDDGGGNAGGGGAINDSEGADSKGLAANKKPRHSSESWNPGKTTHSGPGRNDLSGLAGGTIHIKAKNKAVVSGSAQITAVSEAGKGGHIQITGDKVGLMGLARLDASGAAGGGEILLGGDYKGQNAKVKNARVTYVGKGARLSADAKTKGKGGRVIVWADDTTRYHGRISARGGAQGGDGGFVEVSGKRYLAFRGKVDVNAPKGRAGTLLLDPNDLCIGGNASCTQGGATATEDTNTGGDDIFNAASSTANSWVSQTTLDDVGNANILLQASNDIFFDSNISLGAVGATTGPNAYNSRFSLVAGRNINMNNNNLTLNGNTSRASFFAAGSITLGTGQIKANRIDLSAAGTVSQSATGRLEASNLHLNIPLRTSALGGTISDRIYSGNYILDGANRIANLHVNATAANSIGDLFFRDDDGFELATAINTGLGTGASRITLTLQSNGEITQATGAEISGTGNLVVRGTGRLTLSRANSYTGTTTVEADTSAGGNGARLRIQNVGALGPLSGGKVTVQKNASLILDLTSTDSFVNFRKNLELEGEGAEVSGNRLGALRFVGGGTNITSLIGGTITLTGDATIHNDYAFTIATGTGAAERTLSIIADLRLQGAVGTPAASTPYNLTITGRGYTSIGAPGGFVATKKGVISGTGELIKDGSGQLEIRKRLSLGGSAAAADNLYTGTFRMKNGTLGFNRLTVSNRSSLIVEGGTVNMSTNNFTLRGVELKGGSISGSGTLTLNTGNFILEDGTVGPSLAGSAGLIKQGAATTRVTLARANTYTGATQVNAGTLRINNAGGLNGTSDVTVGDNSTLELNFANGAINKTLRLGNNSKLAALQGTATWSGAITLTGGDGNLVIFSAANGATLNVGPTTGILNLGNAATPPATSTLRNLLIEGAGTVNIRSRVIGGGGLTKRGTGDLRLTAAANATDYSGDTAVEDGSLTLTGSNQLSDDSLLVVKGGRVALGTHNDTVAGVSLESGSITRSSSGTGSRGVLTVALPTDRTAGNGVGEFEVKSGRISAILGGTNINLVKRSDGSTGTNPGGLVTLSYSGNHTLTGNVSVEAGRLVINGRMTGSILVVGTAISPGTYDLAGNTQIFGGVRLVRGSITDSGRLVSGTRRYGALTVGNTSTSTDASANKFDLRSGTVSAKLSGAGELVKGGAANSTVTLSNNTGVTSDYTGATTINAGTLAITSSGALGNTSGVTVNSGGVLALSSTGGTGLTLNRALTLAGGALGNVQGNNTYSGNLTLTADNSIIRSTVGTRLTVSGNLVLQSGAPLVARNLTIRGAGDVVLSGIISGLGGLIKGVDNTDRGRLTLSSRTGATGANTYAGATTVNFGVLRVSKTGALGAATTANTDDTTVASGATLELDGVDIAAGESLSLAGNGHETTAGDTNTALGALRSVSGNNTVRGAITLRANVRIYSYRDITLALPATTPDPNNSLTLAGVISGTNFGLEKIGPGKLTLTNLNTYTGRTKIDEGELELNNTDSTKEVLDDESDVDLADGAAKLTVIRNETIGTLSGGGTGGGAIEIRSGTLTVDQEGNEQYDGIISGAGNLKKTGTGTLGLGGTNTYTGTTEVNQGTLSITNSRALGPPTGPSTGGAVTVNSGATLELAGNGLNVNKALTLVGVAASRTGGILANTGGNNTWSGAITVAATGIITSEAGNTLTVSNTIALNSADGGLLTQGAGNIILSNSISGAGNISKSGNGVLELGGNNTYQGETSVSGGTLRVTHQNALGAATAPRTAVRQPITTLGSGATLELAAGASGAFTIGETLHLASGGGTLRNVSGSNIWSGRIRFNITSDTPSLTIENNQTDSTGAATLTLQGILSPVSRTPAAENPALTVTGSGHTLISGQINTGRGALTKEGSGKLTLSGNNTRTGATTVTAGTLRLEGDNALNDNAAVALNNAAMGNTARLEIAGNETIGPLSGRGTVDIEPNRRLTIRNDSLNASDDTTYNGIISGARAAGLRKTGRRKLTLGGANTYAGTTLVEGGTLAVSNNLALGLTGAGNNTIVSNGAILALSSATSINVGEALTLNAGGTLGNLLNGDNTYSGQITLGGAATSTTNHTIQSTAGTLTVTQDLSLQETVGSATHNRNLTVTGAGIVVLSGIISGAGDLIRGASFTPDAQGRLTLSGTADNTYTGRTWVRFGTLHISKTGALGAADNTASTGTTVDSGATLELDGVDIAAGENLSLAGPGIRGSRGTGEGNGALRNVRGNNTVGSAITLSNANVWITAAAGTTLTLTGNIGQTAGSTFGLIKDGAGTLTLRGTNTYTGLTDIRDGELELDGITGDALGDTSAVNLSRTANAKRLTVTRSETIGNLSGGGSISISRNQNLTVNQTTDIDAGRLSYGGIISGDGGLIKGGVGELLLNPSSPNTYQGATEVNGGKLSIEHEDALGGTGTGSGTTVKNGAALELSSSNLNVAEPLTLEVGGRLVSAGRGNTYSGNITLSGMPTAGTRTLEIGGSNTLNVSGYIIGGNRGIILLKTGAGVLTLSGDNEPNVGAGRTGYLGAIQVNAGTLRVTHNNALGSPTGAATTIGSGATLELAGGMGSLTIRKSRLLLANGSTLKNVSGTNTLSNQIIIPSPAGDPAPSVSVTINNEKAPASSTDTTPSLTLQGGIGQSSNLDGRFSSVALSFTGVGNTTVNNGIQTGGAGTDSSLTKDGTGRLRLNGQSAYTGATNIKQGTLAIGQTDAINTGSRLIVGQLQSGMTSAVQGTFAMDAYNQTFRGVQLNAGFITATPSAASTTPPTQGILTVNPARGSGETTNGIGEFDVRDGEIQAILAGPADLVKRSDGTTAGGTVTLTFTGNHLYSGETRILAGSLIIRGSNPNSILVILGNSTYDLVGEDKSYRGVRLEHGSIVDSGKAPTALGGRRTYGSLTVNSGGQFNLQSGTVSAKLAGSGVLVKNARTAAAITAGAANLVTLSGDNTYTGNTTINSGILRISHVNALGLVAGGSTTKDITVNATDTTTGTLQLAAVL